MKRFILIAAISASALLSCPLGSIAPDIDFRQEMRNFVIGLSNYARGFNEDFIVIPQNGQELVTDNGEPDGVLQSDYLKAIDASAREDLFFGYDGDDVPTPADETAYLLELCQVFEKEEVEILAVDYCFTRDNIDSSYLKNSENGFISFAAEERDLNTLPTYPSEPFNSSSRDISNISEAANFLYLINGENFSARTDFIAAVSQTDFDVLIIDLFHNEEAWTVPEILELKTKNNGGSRLVICYMSIGEAENYRYYWEPEWSLNKPGWLGPENPDWEGNYKVQYWQKEWQDIIYGNGESYLKMIIDAGFDGAYLDIIDAFEFYEDG